MHSSANPAASILLMGAPVLSEWLFRDIHSTGRGAPTPHGATLARNAATAANAACRGARHFESHGCSVGRTPLRVHHTKKEMFL